jgi:hypothetical protein
MIVLNNDWGRGSHVNVETSSLDDSIPFDALFGGLLNLFLLYETLFSSSLENNSFKKS